MTDKRMSAAEVVAQLKDGMTIGIGGWGPRRKPMALVREILRSPVKDLTVVGLWRRRRRHAVRGRQGEESWSSRSSRWISSRWSPTSAPRGRAARSR